MNGLLLVSHALNYMQSTVLWFILRCEAFPERPKCCFLARILSQRCIKPTLPLKLISFQLSTFKFQSLGQLSTWFLVRIPIFNLDLSQQYSTWLIHRGQQWACSPKNEPAVDIVNHLLLATDCPFCCQRLQSARKNQEKTVIQIRKTL